MRVSRWGLLLVLGSLGVPAGGCREEPASNFDSNRAPETYVSYAPAESTQAFYRIHLFWNGSDPDGVVSHYEYAVTDSNKVPGEDTPGFDGYFRTDKTDSVFVLKADNPQTLGHRFYIRAVDNEGKKDPTPAWSYFIALDTNFPSVHFLRGTGTWTQRDGSTGTVALSSNNRFTPTDTIGVGGSISLSWCGYDLDRGAFNPSDPCRPQDLLGYEYRASTDQAYLGGTLGDTTFSKGFAPPPGSPLSRWYSGSEVLRVRAIDEAGAKTNPDSIRSVVVNFNPRAWILEASSPTTLVRSPSFIDRQTMIRYPSGTVLALNEANRNITFYFTGLDDPRDMSLNPSEPNGITGFSYRRLIGQGGPAYREINPWVQYPQPNAFSLSDASNLQSGDYTFLLRARDELGRWGAPDTVRVGVNYRPYFLYVDGVVEGDTTAIRLWPQSPPATLTFRRDSFGFYPDLEIRILASDVHPHPDHHPLDPNPVVEEEIGSVPEYRASLNDEPAVFILQETDEPFVKFYAVSESGEPGFVREGLNRLEMEVKDVPGRSGSLTIVFQAVFER